MDLNLIWTILSILIGGFFSVWAIRLAYRSLKRVEITFVEIQCISLIDDIAQNLGDLQITFREKAISDNLVLLTGFLVNTGRRDISKDMVEDVLTAQLEEGFEFIDCSVTGVPDSVRCDISERSSQAIKVNTGLWKMGENFRFDALVKVPLLSSSASTGSKASPSRRLLRAISFQHRIADCKGVVFKQLPTKAFPRRLANMPQSLLRFMFSGYFIGVTYLVMGGVFLFVLPFITPNEVGFQIHEDRRDKTIYVRVDKNDVMIYYEDGVDRKLTQAEFNELHPIAVILPPRKSNFYMIFGAIVAGVGLFSLLLEWYGDTRSKKLSRMIGVNT